MDDVGVLQGAVGEPLFMLQEGGQQFPAPVLSDGTLRFAAIAAAFFQPDAPRLMTMEEIENGVHASRLRLLVELLRSQAETRDTQIVATTHSPLVLAWLREEEYKTTLPLRARRIDGRIHDPSLDRRAPLHGRRQKTADRRSAGGRLAGNGAVSFRALVVPEDPALNGYILKPLAQGLLAKAGKPHARVKLLTDPRVRGYDFEESTRNLFCSTLAVMARGATRDDGSQQSPWVSAANGIVRWSAESVAGAIRELA